MSPTLVWVTAFTLTALSGCARRDTVMGETDESEPTLASAVSVSQPLLAKQLVAGFHDVESNGWRWTEGKFSVALAVPPASRTKGARLKLGLFLSEQIIQKYRTQTLSAKIGGCPLAPETYSATGEYVYSRPVDARCFKGDNLLVQFSLDHYGKPGEFDGRELGLVVTSVSLEVEEMRQK